MTTMIKHEVEMACSPEQLFGYVTRPWLWHQWHPNSMWAESNVEELGVGDRFHELYAITLFPPIPFKIKRHLHYEVLESIPNRLWRVRARGKDNEINFCYEFSPSKTGVLYTRTLTYELKGISVVMTPWMRRRNREMSVEALSNLKARAEAMERGE